MDFNALQIILVFIVTFIAAIDQFSFLESLYQPIVVGPVVGAILGDLQIGLVVGGTYQLIQIGSMPIGGAQPPNAVIGGVVATIFAVGLGLEPAAAVGIAVPFAILGQMMVTLIFTLFSPLMGVADKAADEANPAGIRNINLLSMTLLGTAFGIVAVLALTAGSAFGPQIEAFFNEYAWLRNGFEVGGGMLRYVGFATLLRIMMSGELWGYYFAGFALATIVGAVGYVDANGAFVATLGGSALLIISFIGVAIALADYQANVKIKNLAGTVGHGGDEEDGI